MSQSYTLGRDARSDGLWKETDDSLKAALAFADLPTYREWCLSIAAIGDNWKK